MLKIVSILSFIFLSITYLEHALLVFQQNRYGLDRYTKWLLDFKNIKVNGYFTYVAISFIAEYLFTTYVKNIEGLMVTLVTIITAILFLYKETKKSYIKPLVYTDRVKRQVLCIGILDVLYIILFMNLGIDHVITAVLVPIISWLLIYPMGLITSPIEGYINKGFENEARAILEKSPELKKVAITGSYGKTSTKNVLNAILDKKYYTLMTPASYNTPMGITRVIRENLKPYHELFLCEMGADHVDDIRYLVDMVKPSIGVLTSIGPQHLNTFGSIDNIIKEKCKVIEMLPNDGVGIINMDNDYIRSHNFHTKAELIRIGIDSEDVDFRAYDINYDQNGASFKVMIDDEEVLFETALLGKHNIINILLGIALGQKLGVSISDMQDAIKDLRPIEHRLETKIINGYHFIDNAFNSNPVSSKLSLDVLSKMPNKRIIITPGLIDLGKDEYRYNKEFGLYMPGKVDHVVLVGQVRAKAIVEGLKEGGFDMAEVKIVDDVKEAFGHIYQNFTKDDTILLENDLPDVFLR